MPTRTFLLTVLLSLPLVAQEKGKNVSLRLLTALDRTTITDAQLRTPDWEGEKFRLPYNQLSRPQEVEARALRLFRPAEGGEYEAVCDVVLPENGSKFIAILVPEEEGKARAIVLDGDAPGFRPGDVFIFNASENAIALALGTTRAALKPGQGKPFRPGAPADAKSYEVALLYEDAGTARRLALTQWPLNDKLRGYVFFVPGKHGRPSYRAVQEVVLPPEKP